MSCRSSDSEPLDQTMGYDRASVDNRLLIDRGRLAVAPKDGERD
jgi:hypothetical protein